jgi:hypothetical protein
MVACLGCFTHGYCDESKIYQIQKKRLFSPAKVVRKAEELRQSVFIYDGMKEGDIEKAMEEQFDRVENMMFVRTLVTNEEGEEEVEEDGCD